MYGASGKLGRGGGGRGHIKRNVPSAFQAPTVHRQSSAAPGGRLSLGAGHRDRAPAPSPAAFSSGCPGNTLTVEETFRLVPGDSLNFAVILKLAPSLVEEIKRVEAEGGTARIKFDANGNNSVGNVIEVGGNDFKFTWSKETGVCDIYEECQSGEDGNGLLVETGSASRKLNMQRVLDESTKKQVKMRSEEAERKHKSRKAIVLEHESPTMKSQVKALQAAEVNPRRIHFNQKKEPPSKKRKVEPSSVTAGRPLYKPGLMSTTPLKSRPSASPLLSPPERSGAPSSPLVTSILPKGCAKEVDVIPPQVPNKENAATTEKELPSRVGIGAVQDRPLHKGNLGSKSTDLQCMLISLLMEKPKGMSLKALEKAVGDTVPNSVKLIEPIIKKIAVFQAPGRYFLKPGVEWDGVRKHSFESGSSPEDNPPQVPALEDNSHNHQMPAPEDDTHQIPAVESIFTEIHSRELEREQLASGPAEDLKVFEEIDILHDSPEPFGEKKGSDNSGDPAGSSSDSDSESNSTASGSDSGSHSRSRSRSPVGSASESSSDSESDASSSSKEGSDEDVDIMTSDDDKESKHELQASEPGIPISPNAWRNPDGSQVQNGFDEKQEDPGSDIVEIEKDSPADDEEGEVAVGTYVDSSREHQTRQLLPESHEQERKVKPEDFRSAEETIVKNNFKEDQSNNSMKITRGKINRSSEGKLFDDHPDYAKRIKAVSQPLTHEGRNTPLSEYSHKSSFDGPIDCGPLKGTTLESANKMVVDETEFGLRKDCPQTSIGRSVTGSQQLDQRSIDISMHAKPPTAVERPARHDVNLSHNIKHPERCSQLQDGYLTQREKDNQEILVNDGYTDEKRPPRSLKVGGFGDRSSVHSAPVCRKPGDAVVKYRDSGSIANSQWSSPKINRKTGVDKSPIRNGQDRVLQRELSDLELGELREPGSDEMSNAKKQIERNSSSKRLEKPSSSDYWNFDANKGKPAGKTVEARKPSPPHTSVGFPDNLEAFKKRTPENCADDISRSAQKVVQSQPSHLSRCNQTESAALHKALDPTNKFRDNEVGYNHDNNIDTNEDTHRKVSIGASKQHDTKRILVSCPKKGHKRQKSNMLADSVRRKETPLIESIDGCQKRKVSSSVENDFFKYEKEGPELKGPIKDPIQYNEYVQEYREKYDSYCSINKILESDRIKFSKLGKELDSTRERDTDRYRSILAQLMESYAQCGTRHKRLKKIFVVLHEELTHLKQMINDFAVSYRED